ncbi:MAG: hypothetical protein WAK93_17830 [Solirubrobacteraceae bacterium]
MSRRLAACVAGGLAALAMGGCGAAHEIGSVVDPVAQAADATATVPGYRLTGTIAVSSPAFTVHGTLSGWIDRAKRAGTLTTTESVAGRTLTLNEKFSGLTFYMASPGTPQLKSVTGGKPWLKFDMSRLLGGLGGGALPAGGSSDPSQFIDFLRAVGGKATKLGTAAIRGVATTHYRAIVDLDRYTKLVAPSERASASKTVSMLEQALGSHTMTMDVWIDQAHKLVRRMSFDFAECVNGQRLQYAMAMDLFDYGPQPPTTLPSAAKTYDLTPLLSSAMSKVKFGCSNSA